MGGEGGCVACPQWPAVMGTSGRPCPEVGRGKKGPPGRGHAGPPCLPAPGPSESRRQCWSLKSALCAPAALPGPPPPGRVLRRPLQQASSGHVMFWLSEHFSEGKGPAGCRDEQTEGGAGRAFECEKLRLRLS